MTKYDYHKPRRLNLVSGFIGLVILAAIYAGWKFIPVYWQARKVDAALDEIKLPAAEFVFKNEDVKTQEGERMLAAAIARLHDMGIDDMPDQPLQVWWGPDYTELHAKYRVIVTHPAILKPTILDMERVRKVPKR